MQLFNVLSKQEFVHEGKTTKLWHKVGIIKISKSKNMFLQLFQYPNTDFYVVEPKDKPETEEQLDMPKTDKE